MNNYGRIVQKRVLLLKLEIASSNCVLDKYISIAHYHLGAAMGATNEYQWDPGGVRLKIQGYPGVLFVAFAINCVVEGLIQEGRCKSKNAKIVTVVTADALGEAPGFDKVSLSLSSCSLDRSVYLAFLLALSVF
jgi:hypothetical protein